MNPFTAAENNGRNFSTTYESLPCLTGNGSDNYVDLGSALIPATADFEINLWYYHVTSNTTRRWLIDQWTSGQAGRLALIVNSASAVGTAGSMELGINDLSAVINLTSSLSSAAWHKVTLSRTGSTFRLTCATLGGNVFMGTTTFAGSVFQKTTNLLNHPTESLPNNGRIAYFTITTGGVNKEVPLTAGSGADLTLYTDDVESTLSTAVKGTLTSVWANKTPINIPSSKNAIRAISPRNSQFRREAADGDDRFAAFSAQLTGTDLTNMTTFTD
jgi:hypothetical protein